MTRFSTIDDDPREQEWVDRIINTVSSVLIESMPTDDTSLAFIASNVDELSSILPMVLMLQLDSLLDPITDKVISHVKGPQPVTSQS